MFIAQPSTPTVAVTPTGKKVIVKSKTKVDDTGTSNINPALIIGGGLLLLMIFAGTKAGKRMI